MWGGSFVAIKIGLNYLTPGELVLARFIPSALLLFPIGIWAQRRSGYSFSPWVGAGGRAKLELIAASLFAVPFYHFCLNFGETMIPSGWASLVISLNPACITLFAAWLLHEPVGLKRWLGLGIALTALIFITLTNNAMTDDGTPGSMGIRLFGIFVTLGSVISWGGFTVISKRIMKRSHPLSTLGWAIGLGTLWVLPFFSKSLIDKIVSGPADLWWAIIYLSIGCTVVGFAMWFWALDQWQASRAGAFIYLVPVVALSAGWLFLNEPLDWLTVLGAAGVLWGVIIAGGDRGGDYKRV